MGDDKRAVNTEASLRNGTSQPRVGIGVFASQQGRVTADAPRISSRSWVLEHRWRQAGFSGSSRGRRRPGSLRRGRGSLRQLASGASWQSPFITSD
jgi:hypothetical protein